MNKAIAKKWVAALRSGKYRQTTATLRKNGAFCCLGVLCNLHAEAHPKIAATQRKAGAYLGSSVVPPPAVLAWAGLKNGTGFIDTPMGGTLELTNLNDSGVYSFAQIADVIEKHVEAL